MPADLTPWQLVLIGAFALLGSTVGAVTGFGFAAILLPVLAMCIGEQAAVPVLTVAQIVGNGSRAWFNRTEIRWSAVRWYTIGGVPAAFLGALLFATMTPSVIAIVMGASLLVALAWRRWGAGRTARGADAAGVRIREPQLVPVGVVTGALSALVGGAGPIAGPFFLAVGLVKGAYIGSEAVAALGVHLAKVAAYSGTGTLTGSGIVLGLSVSPLVIAGSWIGKRIVNQLSQSRFIVLVECALAIAALLMLWRGWAAASGS